MLVTLAIRDIDEFAQVASLVGFITGMIIADEEGLEHRKIMLATARMQCAIEGD